MEETALALLALLHQADGLSIARCNKQLGIAMSQMNRLLLVFGREGMGWIEVQEQENGRRSLRLTDEGRRACSTQ